jgi:hypothetical protein
MIDRLKYASRHLSCLVSCLAAATFMLATPVSAQAPTDAQRAAIKSECRSDYMAHCSSIPPGGAASLQCLQKNMASLSSACASAVRAVEAPSEPKAEARPESKPEAAPAAAATKPADEAPAKTEAAKTPAETPAKTSPPKAAASTTAKPSSAQISAIRSACRSDYPNVCAGVPTGGAPALQCLEKNKAKVSASCQKALAAAGGTAPATEGGAAAAAAPAAAPERLVLRPLRPREELFVLRSACGADVRSLCGGVAPGGGRIIQCLAGQSASLSAECRGVLGQFAAQ